MHHDPSPSPVPSPAPGIVANGGWVQDPTATATAAATPRWARRASVVAVLLWPLLAITGLGGWWLYAPAAGVILYLALGALALQLLLLVLCLRLHRTPAGLQTAPRRGGPGSLY